MAKGNFPPALTDVLVHEGDYTNDRRDPGNWTGGKVGVGELKGTKKGIAAASYPHLDIKNLTDTKIAEIYEANYWRKIQGDELPAGVDLSGFDYSVNSGVSHSAKVCSACSASPSTVVSAPSLSSPRGHRTPEASSRATAPAG